MVERRPDTGSFVVSENVVSRELADGETVLLDLGSEEYFSVNSLGGMIWSCLASGESLDSLVEHVSKDCGHTAEAVRRDVDEFIEELLAAELIRLRS